MAYRLPLCNVFLCAHCVLLKTIKTEQIFEMLKRSARHTHNNRHCIFVITSFVREHTLLKFGEIDDAEQVASMTTRPPVQKITTICLH